MNTPVEAEPNRALSLFIVAGEESGDALGGGLMRALSARYPAGIRYQGLGGRAMEAEGLSSLFPIAEIATMGLVDVAARLPRLLARIRQTAGAAVDARPDALVIIDSPDFTHRVARRVRWALPDVPIINYVSPSIWAWRPARARAMRAYVDHVLALLPFEPAAHAALGGPPCTYVGHPLGAKIGELRPSEQDARRREADPPVVLVLPGSRRTEVARLLPVFAAAIESVIARHGPLELILPTVPHLESAIRTVTTQWPIRPQIVVEPEDKYAAFRIARCALAASGTVTLELALAQVPLVAAYRVSGIEAAVARRLIKVPSVVLTNLVLKEKCVPELLQEACTAESLSAALMPLLEDTAARRQQLAAFERLDSVMEIGTIDPDDKAAQIVLDLALARRQRASAA